MDKEFDRAAKYVLEKNKELYRRLAEGPKAFVLPDLLERGLRIVFCGTAAGKASAQRKLYYAGRNKFWQTLAAIGLTPLFRSDEYRELLEYGIGLTDVAKNQSGADREVQFNRSDTNQLRTRIEICQALVLAFNGKKAAELFLDRGTSYGLQSEQIGRTLIHVLPSTSGSANWCWDIRYWQELADSVKL